MHSRPSNLAVDSIRRLARAMEGVGEPMTTSLHRRSNPPGHPLEPVTLYALSRRDEGGLTVALYARPNDRYTDHVGLLRAQRLTDDEHLESTCARAVRSLASAAGVKPSAPYVVLESDLLSTFHGRGIGAWMYAEAVRLAWTQARAALVADICTVDGVTSLSAGRVWDGAALRLVAHVEDRAAIWRSARRAVPAPAGVKMRSYRMSS